MFITKNMFCSVSLYSAIGNDAEMIKGRLKGAGYESGKKKD